MQSVGNIRELFGNDNEAPLSKDQIVRKKLEKMGVTGENLFSESFKLSTTALVEERLKEKVYESYQDIAEVNFGVADVTAYDNRSLRLKLLFVDIGETNTAIYAFMKMAGLVPKFGKIHTALAVGNKIVEWNDSSICYPRECTSSKAILAVDLATLQGEKVDSGIKALADVIVKWNTTREYSMMNGNCQNFVDECLTALGIEPTFKGLFGEYVANVRKTGSCTIQLRLSEELQEEFGEQFMKELGFENNCITFERHDELDRFTWKILDRFNETFGDDGIKIGPERIEPHHKELYAMLKAFDRGFWLRMRKGDPNQCPHNHGNMEPRKCPWRDPIETHTNWTPSSRQPKFAISQNSGNTSTAPKQAQKGGACNLQ